MLGSNKLCGAPNPGGSQLTTSWIFVLFHFHLVFIPRLFIQLMFGEASTFAGFIDVVNAS